MTCRDNRKQVMETIHWIQFILVLLVSQDHYLRDKLSTLKSSRAFPEPLSKRSYIFSACNLCGSVTTPFLPFPLCLSHCLLTFPCIKVMYYFICLSFIALNRIFILHLSSLIHSAIPLLIELQPFRSKTCSFTKISTNSSLMSGILRRSNKDWE